MKKTISMMIMIMMLATITSGCFFAERGESEKTDSVNEEVPDNTEGSETIVEETTNEENSESITDDEVQDENVDEENKVESSDSTDNDDEANQVSENTLTDSGSYNGQVDSNFIEISVSGVPTEEATRVYMLSEDIKNNFEQYNLESGDSVRFDYIINENEQMIIIDIKKI